MEIASDLAGAFSVLSGQKLNLFVDKVDDGVGLTWGDAWKLTIDSALEHVAFFIPVLSPTFFTRP